MAKGKHSAVVTMSNPTSEEITAKFASEIKNRVFLVTGTTQGGLGYHSAKTLLEHSPKLVIVTGRSQDKVDATIAALTKDVPAAKNNIRGLVLELSSLDAVRKAAKEVNAYQENIDVMIQNAAVMGGDLAKTVDGYEKQFACNHLGPFLFIRLILEKILASPSPRLVIVSSSAHRMAPVFFDDLNFEHTPYQPMFAYGHTKTANILMAKQLAVTYPRLKVFSLNPGTVSTNLQRSYGNLETLKSRIQYPIRDYKGNEVVNIVEPVKSVTEGAATQLYAALDPALGPSGAFLMNCQVETERLADHANDPALATRLWDVSNKMVGLQ